MNQHPPPPYEQKPPPQGQYPPPPDVAYPSNPGTYPQPPQPPPPQQEGYGPPPVPPPSHTGVVQQRDHVRSRKQEFRRITRDWTWYNWVAVVIMCIALLPFTLILLCMCCMGTAKVADHNGRRRRK